MIPAPDEASCVEVDLSESLIDQFQPMIESLQSLTKQAIQQYVPLVDQVIREQSKDHEQIKHLLDGMLDFCFDDAMLEYYKKLCRYYFKIDPNMTAEYVYAYRDLWDEKFQEENNLV